MPTSTFPGAIDVNTSLWVGGNLSSGTDQWLPYWANGNVPLLMLIRATNATSRLDPGARLEQVIESTVHYVLSHANRSSGWLGPYLNEPGDANGHGLWDPLNMLRALLMYAEGDQEGGRSMARRGTSRCGHAAWPRVHVHTECEGVSRSRGKIPNARRPLATPRRTASTLLRPRGYSAARRRGRGG